MELIVKHEPIDVEEEKLDSEIIELARVVQAAHQPQRGASAGPLKSTFDRPSVEKASGVALRHETRRTHARTKAVH